MPLFAARTIAVLLLSSVALLAVSHRACAQEMAAVVHKASVAVHGTPDFNAPAVATLKRNAPVNVTGQQGLWFHVALADGQSGYVRVTDVRMASTAGRDSPSDVRALFTGKAGQGRVTETAGVRGLDESSLKSAAFDRTQLARVESYRVSPQAAESFVRGNGWRDTDVPFAAEARPGARGGATQAEKRGALSAARGLLSRLGGGLLGGNANTAMDVADAAAGKSEDELLAEELALGPEIAGRVLGAAPLWDDDAAQRRVNLIGRWVASRTTRPELPWTFGVIDSSEVNAFAAPGGYVLVTRGLYRLLADDAEIAAVLGHEISHVVQRDHYDVIRKQALAETGGEIVAGHVDTGGNLAAGMMKDYLRRHGAAVMLTSLDRDVEYRSDEAAGIYLARAGCNPLALYAVLQKMLVLGMGAPQLAQLYRTHPPLDERLDRLDRRGYDGLERYTTRD